MAGDANEAGRGQPKLLSPNISMNPAHGIQSPPDVASVSHQLFIENITDVVSDFFLDSHLTFL